MVKSLSRKDNHRKSLLRNLATSVILYEEIKTTTVKAKAVKPIVENLINSAKKNNLAARRALLGYLFDKQAVDKVFEVLVPRFKNKDSGFIKILKLSSRLGDSAPMAILRIEKESAKPESAIKIEKKIDKEKNAPESGKTTPKTSRK